MGHAARTNHGRRALREASESRNPNSPMTPGEIRALAGIQLELLEKVINAMSSWVEQIDGERVPKREEVLSCREILIGHRRHHEAAMRSAEREAQRASE